MISKLINKQSLLYAIPVIVAVGLLVASLIDRTLMGPFFIHSAIYADLAMVLFWIALTIQSNQSLTREGFIRGLKDNWLGLVITFVVSTAIINTVEPSLRILADETNLLGVSKDLFYQRSATLTISAKWYYETLWPLSSVIERRPTLYPFFVCILHFFRGFSVSNAFLVNAIVIPLFVFQGYRFAKALGGETFGVAAGLLVLAHPVVMMSARSGGFDVIAAFFALLVLKSFLDHCCKPSADTLAMLWLYLCMSTHVRYEGVLTQAIAFVALFALRLVRWSDIRPRLLLYVVSPLLLLPRFWQAIVKANDQEEPLSITLFSLRYLRDNSVEYLKLLRTPFDFSHPHNPLVILLGLLGLLLILSAVRSLYTTRPRNEPFLKFTLFAAAWFLITWVLIFSYVWGKSLHPASTRLFVVVDAAFSLSAAWFITVTLRRFPQWITMLLSASFIFFTVPVASEARLLNQLTLTRHTAQCWRYFERLNDKRILIITDRPGMYSVMNYGAMDLSVAKQNRALLTELSRHLFQDIYVIQEINLTTKKPTPATEIWPTVDKETVQEFQNDANLTTRISRIKHKERY
jgi:hypothetical protein